MFFSCFDDSSDDKRQEYVSAGGLICKEEQWIAFGEDWVSATQHLKQPFRSTDCECQHGQFAGWDKRDCDALITRLVDLLVEHRIGGFASVVPVNDFRAAFPDLDEFSPYLLAVEHTLLNMARSAAQGDDVVQVWLEDGTAPIAVVRIYDKLKKLKCWEHRDRLVAVSLSDKQMPQLQAADLIARESVKHFLNRGVRPMRKPFERLQHRVGFLRWNYGILKNLSYRGWPDNPREPLNNRFH
jgi:hypothetical protein